MGWLMDGKGEMFNSPAPAPAKIEAGEGSSSGTPLQASGLTFQPGFAEQISASPQVHPQSVNSVSVGKNLDKPSRRIAEIRVFYDDGTFETFSAKQ